MASTVQRIAVCNADGKAGRTVAGIRKVSDPQIRIYLMGRMKACCIVVLVLASNSASGSPSAISILKRNCESCHGSAAMSGLSLETRDALLKGGRRGPALIPGNRKASLLYEAVRRTGDLKMPPGKQALSVEDVEIIGKWIDGGATWDAAPVTAADNSWWAFRKPVRPAVPRVNAAAWVSNPIDAFILAQLEAKGLRPNAPASPQALVRRVYFDLTGLPPNLEEVDAFVKDPSREAYEKMVDHLLASPQYGERWGRYWLDLVRYADTGGYEHDIYLQNAWRYRDYVIQSFNQDKPYDQFVQEQIAADEIWPNNLELEGTYDLPKKKLTDLERRIGTGMYTIGPILQPSYLNPDQFRYERLGDFVDTTSAVFMGLTVACARCHDHKFDPIPQKDYYRMQAIFAASEEKTIPMVDATKISDYYRYYTKKVAVDDLKDEIGRLHKSVQQRLIRDKEKQLSPDMVDAARVAADKRTPEQKRLADEYRNQVRPFQRAGYEKIKGQYTAEEARKRADLIRQIGESYLDLPVEYPTALVLGHVEEVPELHVAIRGDWKNKGEKVGPGFLSCLSDGKELDTGGEGGFGSHRRKDFALWLTRKDHPLTSRVIVNRLWQGHFGTGIVPSSSNFGRQGDPPSNPELLDWLAVEFVQQGWSMKAMHRLMLLSNTYRMSSQSDAQKTAIDPENKYFWRANSRRLEAESVRDSVLAVSGKLNPQAGGPPVFPFLSDEERDGIAGGPSKWPITLDEAAQNRRGVYLFVKRAYRYPFFEIFDSPDATITCERRSVTNVAPQALALLNNRFMFQQAEAFAARLMKESGDDPAGWIERGFRRALGRSPSPGEKEHALALLSPGIQDRRHTSAAAKPERPEAGLTSTPSGALTRFCLMLFNLNEFLFMD